MNGVLLADIGGTNARFAVLSRRGLGPVRSLDVKAHPGPLHAVRHFLSDDRSRIDEAVLAVAGPVEGGRCILTNSRWTVDAAELKRELGLGSVRLLNDHEAIGWSLPRLSPDDVLTIGPATGLPDAPMGLLGPGTGLGLACYIPGDAGARVLASEGGHMTLAATTDREAELIAVLRRQFVHVSAERVLSGPGLVNLYRATSTLDHVEVVPRSPAEVTRAALDGTCEVCRRTFDAFVSFLGSFAGDIALLFGARGGVFIGGGILPHIAARIDTAVFRERFEAKGRFRQYLSAIPIRVILRPDPAFVGLAALIRDGVSTRGKGQTDG
jgi:glucokinase